MKNYAVATERNGRLIIDGRTDDHETIPGQIRYRTVAQIIPEGGTMQCDTTRVSVLGADAVTILISIATNFNNYRDVSGDPVARVRPLFGTCYKKGKRV